MELYYHRSPLGNFGDDLNAWIWDELLPGWRGWDGGRVLVGVGTLLGADLPRRAGAEGGRFLVAGTGAGYGPGAPADVADRATWDMRSVRGPLSARSLGLPETLGVLDPAMMIARFPAFRGAAGARTGRPVFVPHESTVGRHDWAAACAAAGLDLVSPRDDARAVIARIAGAPTVLAESMHAAILADAFRVPWIPVRIGHKFLQAKWLDWAASLAIPLGGIPPLFPLEDRLFALPRAAARRRAARRGRPPPGAALASRPEPGARHSAILQLQIGLESAHVAAALRRQLARPPLLSDDRRLARQIERYEVVLDGIRRDYA